MVVVCIHDDIMCDWAGEGGGVQGCEPLGEKKLLAPLASLHSTPVQSACRLICEWESGVALTRPASINSRHFRPIVQWQQQGIGCGSDGSGNGGK